jgi:hypothetical protein
MSTIELSRIVSREEWLDARKALQIKEKELTRLRDRLAAERRALPWVKVEKEYLSGGNGKEIDRDQVADVVSEERPPGLTGLGTTLRHEAGDGTLGDVDVELQELAVDAGGIPQGIRRDHLSDECGDLGADGRAAASGRAQKADPVLAKATALPAQDGVG